MRSSVHVTTSSTSNYTTSSYVKTPEAASGNESSASSSPVSLPRKYQPSTTGHLASSHDVITVSSQPSPIDETSSLPSDSASSPPPSLPSSTTRTAKPKPPPPVLVIDGKDYSHLQNYKVADLQDQLRKHRAATKGTKPQLLSRLAKVGGFWRENEGIFRRFRQVLHDMYMVSVNSGNTSEMSH